MVSDLQQSLGVSVEGMFSLTGSNFVGFMPKKTFYARKPLDSEYKIVLPMICEWMLNTNQTPKSL